MVAYKLRTFEGHVVRFFREKAYGYIRLDASPREAHFHLRDCEDIGGDMIKKGDRMRFYLSQGARGLDAIRCSKVE